MPSYNKNIKYQKKLTIPELTFQYLIFPAQPQLRVFILLFTRYTATMLDPKTQKKTENPIWKTVRFFFYYQKHFICMTKDGGRYTQ